MPGEDAAGQVPPQRYASFWLVDGRSGKVRTFSFTRRGLSLGIASFILIVVALTVAVIVYTPVGSHLPIADQELEKHYGEQIAGIQKQLLELAREMTTLTVYNLRLRRALGEKISAADSMLASSGEDTTRLNSLHDETLAEMAEARDKGAHVPAGGQTGRPFSEAEPRGHAEQMAQMPLTMPAEGYLSRGFDPNDNHFGIDIAGREGSGILAAADGRVVFSGWTYDDGLTLMIAHPEGFLTAYRHCHSVLVQTGAVVKRGDLIALMGSTGRTSSGPHLHFEVWKNGIANDPQQYLLTTP